MAHRRRPCAINHALSARCHLRRRARGLQGSAPRDDASRQPVRHTQEIGRGRPGRVRPGDLREESGDLSITKTEVLLADEAPIWAEIDELRQLIADGQERGYLTFEQITACLEEVEVTKEQVRELHSHLQENGIDVVDATAAGSRLRAADHGRSTRAAAGGDAEGRRAQEAGDRPDGRAEPRLAAPVPALDRPGLAADRRAGGRAGQAHRARRHARQAADGRGQPAPRRLDRQGLPGPRPDVPGPDPGGLARADPRGREVRLPPRLQVLDVRDVVDPPGRHARDRRQGPHDPHPGPHGREAQQGRARRAPARPAARPRAEPGGDRLASSSARRARCATSCA